MRVPKTLFSCALTAIIIFSFYASPYPNPHILKIENRKAPAQGTEEVVPFNLNNKTDTNLHQQLITTALLNEDPKKRKEAEDSLYDIKAVSPQYKKTIKQLNSDFPYDHLKALHSLKNAIKTNPTIRYIVLRELLPKPLSLEVQRMLTQIADSSLNLQQNLLAIATSNTVDEMMRGAAEGVLAKLHPLHPEIQEALLQKITSDQIPYVIQFSTKNILKLHSFHPEIQEKLVQIVISNEFSTEAQKVAEEILLTARSLTLTTQQELSDTIISSHTSNRGRTTAANIMVSRQYRIQPVTIHPNIQIKLTKAAIADESPDVVRNTVRTVVLDIIINSQKMFHSSSHRHSGIEQELLDTITSDKVSETTRNRATSLITNINPLRESSQRTLLQKATSHTTPAIVKEAAEGLLIHTEYVFPNVKKNMGLALRCRRAFRNLNVFNTK